MVENIKQPKSLWDAYICPKFTCTGSPEERLKQTPYLMDIALWCRRGQMDGWMGLDGSAGGVMYRAPYDAKTFRKITCFSC